MVHLLGGVALGAAWWAVVRAGAAAASWAVRCFDCVLMGGSCAADTHNMAQWIQGLLMGMPR